MNVIMSYVNLINGEAVLGSKEYANPFTFCTDPPLLQESSVIKLMRRFLMTFTYYYLYGVYISISSSFFIIICMHSPLFDRTMWE